MDMMIKTPTMGEILLEEFMKPNNISAYKLAQSINVPALLLLLLLLLLLSRFSRVRLCATP